MQGTSFGSLLASAIFIPITSMVPADLLSWGWRIPFLVAAPLVLVALYIRRSVGETEAFIQTKAANQETKIPVLAVVRDYWPSLLRVIGSSLLAVSGSILRGLRAWLCRKYGWRTGEPDAHSLHDYRGYCPRISALMGDVLGPGWAQAGLCRRYDRGCNPDFPLLCSPVNRECLTHIPDDGGNQHRSNRLQRSWSVHVQ